MMITTKVPGEINGSGVSVRIIVSNRSGRSFDLGGLAVTATYAQDRAADLSTAKPTRQLTGALASGEIARGTYVFTVPRSGVGTLRLEVSSDQSPTIVRFVS